MLLFAEPNAGNLIENSEEGSSIKISNVISLAQNGVANDNPPQISSAGILANPLDSRKRPISLLKADPKNLSPQQASNEPLKLNLIPGARSAPQVIIQFAPNQQSFLMVAAPKQEAKPAYIRPKPPSDLPQDLKLLKSPQALKELFEKILHLFKCMGYKCSYATTSADQFCEHFSSHQAESTQEIGFKKCACCYEVFEDGRSLADHILNSHSYCSFLCGYCFYRALDKRYMTIHQVSCLIQSIFHCFIFAVII